MQPPEFFPRTVGAYMDDNLSDTPEKGQGTERASDRRMHVVTSGVIGGIIAFGILGLGVVVAAVMINWMNRNSEIHTLELRVRLLEEQLQECRDGSKKESDAARAARSAIVTATGSS